MLRIRRVSRVWMKRLRRASRCCVGRGILRARRSRRTTLPQKSGSQSMSIFHDRRDELEKYEFMMGPARGRLAVSLDALTDALILIGQHGVYCVSNRNPSKPALDLETVRNEINGAKELIQSVMQELEQAREASQA